MKFFGFLFALALLPLGAAQAENGCPEGMTPNPTPTGTPGANQCIPIPGFYGSGGDNSAPAAPRAVWETRWGAIAYDPDMGKAGMSSDMTSKRKAINAALDHCKSKGGTSCEVLIDYYNQCAAISYGGAGEIIQVATASAGTTDDAEARASSNCQRAAGVPCKVFYSGCSYAERIR